MAPFVLLNATTLYGTSWTGTAPGTGNPTVSGTIASSTDLSASIKEVSIDLSVADVDFTNFGSGGFMEKRPGLQDADVTISFFNDFAASAVDSLISTAFFGRTLTYWDFKPTSSARSATNPSYVFALYVVKYPPGGFSVGNASETQVGFALAGKYARLTA